MGNPSNVTSVKRGTFAAGCGFAIQLTERIAERAARETKNIDEIRRQRPAVVEIPVQRSGDVLLVYVQVLGR